MSPGVYSNGMGGVKLKLAAGRRELGPRSSEPQLACGFAHWIIPAASAFLVAGQWSAIPDVYGRIAAAGGKQLAVGAEGQASHFLTVGIVDRQKLLLCDRVPDF